MTVVLRDGRTVVREVAEFPGMPSRPLSREALREKFVLLTRAKLGDAAGGLFDRLDGLENEAEVMWVGGSDSPSP